MCMCILLVMSKSKRVQVLMEPAEFSLLERLARQRGTSISDLMREAARAQFLVEGDRLRRTRAAQSYLSLPDSDLSDWQSVKMELEERRGKFVS
jgi:hypothetical protein